MAHYRDGKVGHMHSKWIDQANNLLRKRSRWLQVGMFFALLIGMVGFYVGIPLLHVLSGTYPTNFPRGNATPADSSLTYETITFFARDGIRLAGWYIPSHNGAAIVLTHGFEGNRTNLLELGVALANEGFGVLLYDTRGQGESAAAPSTRGWAEVNDVLGAVDYIKTRADVNPAHIGAFGSSIGGQTTLRAAGMDTDITAVAADGASTAVFADEPPPANFKEWINYPAAQMFYRWLGIVNRMSAPDAVITVLPTIAPRPLYLISTGRDHEQRQICRYFDAAKNPENPLGNPRCGTYTRLQRLSNRIQKSND